MVEEEDVVAVLGEVSFRRCRCDGLDFVALVSRESFPTTETGFLGSLDFRLNMMLFLSNQKVSIPDTSKKGDSTGAFGSKRGNEWFYEGME